MIPIGLILFLIYQVLPTLAICRVSSDGQERTGTSLDSQDEWGHQIEAQRGLKIVEKIKVTMSGEKFPFEYYDKIIDIVKKKKITHLLVYSIDRLARSLPGGARLIQKLWDLNVRIVTYSMDTIGKTPSERANVWMALMMAEIEFNNIHERTRRGIMFKLSNGKYLRNKPPWGYSLRDGELKIKQGYDEIVDAIFTTFIDCREYAKTSRIINKKYGDLLNKKLSPTKVRSIILNTKYMGFFSRDGALIGKDGSPTDPIEEMQAIKQSLFEKANRIASEKIDENTSHSTILDSPYQRYLEEFGSQFIEDYLPFKRCCPKCESINLVKNGSSVRDGKLYHLFKCKDCQHSFRAASTTELENVASLTKLRCMNCGAVNRFDIKESDLYKKYSRVCCTECGFTTLIETSEVVLVKSVSCT